MKLGEHVAPQIVDVSTDFNQSTQFDAIDSMDALAAFANQSCVLEHLEMLRYGRTADWHLPGQLVNRRFGISQLFENRPPRRIRQSLQRLLTFRHRVTFSCQLERQLQQLPQVSMNLRMFAVNAAFDEPAAEPTPDWPANVPPCVFER